MSSIPPKRATFAMMMVVAQRRHAERLESMDAPAPEPATRREATARTSAQKTKGTKRLLAFMYAA